VVTPWTPANVAQTCRLWRATCHEPYTPSLDTFHTFVDVSSPSTRSGQGLGAALSQPAEQTSALKEKERRLGSREGQPLGKKGGLGVGGESEKSLREPTTDRAIYSRSGLEIRYFERHETPVLQT